MINSRWINNIWSTDEYQEEKKKNFRVVTEILNQSPKNLLDIGCGLAWESRMFAEQFGTDLWLIDGDIANNKNKSSISKEVNYHNTADTFLFYHTLDILDAELKKLGTLNYRLIDCNVLDIPTDVKFDLITSWLSCGFHYPVSTYRDLMLNHSHSNTRIIVDLRTRGKWQDPVLESGVEIVSILQKCKKHITAEVKFL